MANDFMKEVDENFVVKDSNVYCENISVSYDIDVRRLWDYVWHVGIYSINTKEILSRYLRINDKLNNLSDTDSEDAENGTALNGRVQRVSIKTPIDSVPPSNEVYLTDQ